MIPASGFYEWQKQATGPEQPFFIRPRENEALFSFAGSWERRHDPEAKIIESCAIITTEANELMPPNHDRRPAILDTASSQMWLDPSASPDALGSLFVPFRSDPMEARAVRSWVSNARKEGPRCLEPVG